MSETFLVLRRNGRDMIKKVYWSSCKVPVILVRFELNLNFLRQIFEKHSNIKFHENPSSWQPNCSMRTEGRTDMMQLIVAFRNFSKGLKKEYLY